ncbi:MAG: hypothetical protein ACR2OR_04540 [Hyphomicrobiales bacterium]
MAKFIMRNLHQATLCVGCNWLTESANMQEKPQKPPQDKQDRLKDALRANLKRRKQQARERRQESDDSSSSGEKSSRPGK